MNIFSHAFWLPGTSAQPPFVRRTLYILPPKAESRLSVLSQTYLQLDCRHATTLSWHWCGRDWRWRHGTESTLASMAEPQGESSSLYGSSGRGATGIILCPALPCELSAHAQWWEQANGTVQAYKPKSLTVLEILWAPLLSLNTFLFCLTNQNGCCLQQAIWCTCHVVLYYHLMAWLLQAKDGPGIDCGTWFSWYLLLITQLSTAY